LNPHYVHADRLSPLTHYDEMLWHVDEAVPAPSLYMDWALAQAAQSQGVRVLLSGTDGDSVVSHGYEALAEYLRTGRWKALAAEAQAVSKRFGSSMSPRQLVWSFGLRLLAPDAVVELWRVLRGRPRVALPVDTPIDAGFARRIGLMERIRALQRDGSSLMPSAREMHWISLSSGLLLYALELLDKVAVAGSLEMRYPFFDRRLVEFCLAVPAEQKLRHGWPRALLRNAMAGILPEQVRCRLSKSHLGSNFTLGLLEHERETLEWALRDAPQTIGGYVDVEVLREMYRRYAAQPLTHEREAATLFLAMTLVMWLKLGSVQPADATRHAVADVGWGAAAARQVSNPLETC
jgi:asparagine synthase (glutamine-hydrolysing)